MACKPRALIIEDDDGHRELLSLFFRRWGWDATAVASGAGPFPKFPEECPELIVLDRALPGETGSAVLAGLRAAGCEAPCVVVTGMPLDVIAGEFDGLGVLALVGKDEAYDALSVLAEDLSGQKTGENDQAGKTRQGEKRS